MAVAAVDEITVDLVSADDETAAETDLRHPRQLFACEHAADRVVGVAEEEYARARRDGPLESFEVDRIAPVGPSREVGAVS